MSRLGKHLRDLRKKKQKSLKKAAPELEVSPSYLSKMENGKVMPSQQTAERLANYYDTDVESLNVMAGRLPEDVIDILQGNPAEAIKFLRERFSDGRRRA